MVAPNNIIPGHFRPDGKPDTIDFSRLDNRKKAMVAARLETTILTMVVVMQNTRAMALDAAADLRKHKYLLRLFPFLQRIVGALEAVNYNLTPPSERPKDPPADMVKAFGPLLTKPATPSETKETPCKA